MSATVHGSGHNHCRVPAAYAHSPFLTCSDKPLPNASQLTNYRLSPSEDSISCIKRHVEVQVYDVATRTLRESVKFSSRIFSHVVMYSADRLTLFAGDESGKIWEWNSQTRRVKLCFTTLLERPVIGLWHNELKDALVSFDRQTFTVYSIAAKSFSILQVLQREPTGAYVAFSNRGSKMVTYCFERDNKVLQKLVLWDLDNQQAVMQKSVVLQDMPEQQGFYLMIKTSSKVLEIWDTVQGKVAYTLNPFKKAITSHEIHPSGKWIVTTGRDPEPVIKVFDITTGSCQSTIPLKDNCTVLNAKIHPSGEFLVVVKDLKKEIEGSGFAQIYKMDDHHVQFQKFLTSSWKWGCSYADCTPDGTGDSIGRVSTSPAIIFHPRDRRFYVSFDYIEQASFMLEPVDVSHSWILRYDMDNQIWSLAIKNKFGEPNIRLLKDGETFFRDVHSPSYMEFDSSAGGSMQRIDGGSCTLL